MPSKKKKNIFSSLNIPLPILISGSVAGFFILFFIIILALPVPTLRDGFDTISDVKSCAERLDENVEMDNTNIIKPDYTTYYNSTVSGFLGSKIGGFLQRLYLKDSSCWSPEIFQKLLLDVTKSRSDMNYRGKFIHKIIPTSNSKFIMWGDVQGAFHSLTRSLSLLKEIGELDENFRLIKPNTNFVFLGDVISRSPHIMETMTLVLRLMERNPNRVFYLRGNHEYNKYWQGYGLKQELQIKASGLGKESETIPLENELESFFGTLPIAIYLGVPPTYQTDFVRLSHEGGDDYNIEPLNMELYADFLKAPSAKSLDTFYLDNKKMPIGKTGLRLRGVIRAEIKRKTYQTMDGMRLIAPEKGATGWTLLSCPTQVYQKGINFFYDAFGVLECGNKIENWTISLHHQDVRKKTGFDVQSYNFLSGKKMLPGAATVNSLSPAISPYGIKN